MTPQEVVTPFFTVQGWTMIFVKLLFNIIVGIILATEAKRRNFNSFLWFLLGSIFSFMAVILFYIFFFLGKRNDFKELDQLD
jgi:hypothetical protein